MFTAAQGDTEQAPYHGRDRFLPLACAKIEHQSLMALESPVTRNVRHFFHQAGFANTCLAAHTNDLPVPAFQTRFHQSTKLRKLGFAADKWLPGSVIRRF